MPDEVFQSIATREGTVEKVPVNSNDIVNKNYADNLTFTNIIPTLDNTYDLGSLALRWKQVIAVIAIVASIAIGGIIGLQEIDGVLWINASTTINGSLNVTGNLSLPFGNLISEQNPDGADAIRIKGTDYIDVVIGGMTGLFAVWNVVDDTPVFFVDERGDTDIVGDFTTTGTGFFGDLDITATSYIGSSQIATLDDLTGGNVTVTEIIRVQNKQGTSVPPLRLMHFSGYNVGQNAPEVQFALSTDKTKQAECVTSETIANNAFGSCVVSGLINNVDTSGFTEDVLLHLNKTAGTMTEVQPVKVDCVQEVGEVLRSHATQGVMFVNVPPGCEEIPSFVNVTGNLTVVDLISCDTIDTTADGLFICGSDETGAGGGGTIINTTQVGNITLDEGYVNATAFIGQPYGYTIMLGQGTEVTAGMLTFGEGSAKETTTNKITWNDAKNYYTITQDGMYEIDTSLYMRSGGAVSAVNISIIIDDEAKAQGDGTISSTADPEHYALKWIGIINAGQIVNNTIDSPSHIFNLERGSTFTIKRIS